MPEDDISLEVKAFIAAHIESVLQLEILLLLHSQRDRQWTAGDVAQELRIDPIWASSMLAGLSDAGVLSASATAPPTFQYQPRSVEIDRAVDELAGAYATRRVTIIGLIFSKPLDNIRSFADAFRIRKDKSDG